MGVKIGCLRHFYDRGGASLSSAGAGQALQFLPVFLLIRPALKQQFVVILGVSLADLAADLRAVALRCLQSGVVFLHAHGRP